MKKGWKVFAGVCAVIIGIGMILCLISYALGGRYSDLDLEYHRVWGPFGYVSGYNDSSHEKYTGYSGSEQDIKAADTSDEFSNVSSIDLEVTGCEVRIEKSTSDKVKVQTENIPKKLQLRYYQEHDGTLSVTTKDKVRLTNSEARIYISIPEGLSFDEADLRIGAGALYASDLKASEMDLEVGAGYAEVNDIKVGDLTVECGAGETIISGESIGDVDIECGIGRVEFNTAGSEEDFYYSLECGIGEIQYGSRQISGVARNVKAGNGASRSMNVDCGMGSVIINFR